MKRLQLAVLFVLGFAVAGAFSGAVIADVTTSTGTTTTETATSVTTTTTASVAPGATLPPGVRVAGVRVGRLTPAAAVDVVSAAFRRPLRVYVDRHPLALAPASVASAYVKTAVAKARIADSGTNVPLVVAVHGVPLRAWVAKVQKRFTRKAVDATLKLSSGKPQLKQGRPGVALDGRALAKRVIRALHANTRLGVHVRTRSVAPQVGTDTYAEVIVINRSLNRLSLYVKSKLKRVFPVATGQSIYPTPAGTWHIVVKWKNPWWYPPTYDSWAKGLKPVPPGPGNPLGTRWMGLDSPGVGIHGTDEPGSIGYSASHGCIRMHVPDAEWLFDRVDVGTTVYVI